MMSSNNYFGFTHGGAQYGQAGQYQTAQTGYAVTPATYTTQRSAYETAYTPTATNSTQATAYATSYGVSTGTPSATSYEYGYARPAAATYQAPVAAATYSTTDYTQQATAKPAYSTNAYAATAARQVPITSQTKVAYTPNTVAYQAQQTVQPVAATYSTAYVTPQAAQSTPAKQEKKPVAKYVPQATTTSYSTAAVSTPQYNQFSNANLAATAMQASGNYNWSTYKKPFDGMRKQRPPPKPQQLHYCDICKISCGGIMTYKEHVEGQKHKKKEQAAKAGPSTAAPSSRSSTSLICELCDVTCTGSDAYAAHIRGAKHQKVVKLHTKLGKPIPAPQQAPKKETPKPAPTAAAPAPATVKPGATAATPAESAEPTDMDTEPEVEPVGMEYIEEIRTEDGKVVFNCKLCDCKFNDPNAKEMHMKGRRHRLQYKKKVDPSLMVDIKISMRHKKANEERLKRQQQREEFFRQQQEWGGPYPMPPMMPRPFDGPMGPMMGPPFFPPMRRPPTSDDRHVMARHNAIYPKNEELETIHKIVSHIEKSLKLVSDQLAEAAEKKAGVKTPVKAAPAAKTEAVTPAAPATPAPEEAKKTDGSDNTMFSFQQNQEECAGRVLKGAMRVGSLAKQLLLTGDTTVDLVVLCAEKPTRSLLLKVAEILPKQLQVVAAEEKYMVQKKPEDAAITVMDTKEPHNTVTITFTSPVVREPVAAEAAADGKPAARPVTKDPPDVLDKTKCLDALAALRHAKWFQARAKGLQHCVIIIRIFRDLCLRVPTWAPLNSWALELLVEKVLSSANGPLSPGDGLRRCLEAVSSGILLPSGPGLLDPCEKEPIDAVGDITNQQREDITASAQHALRMVAFRQVHKVLGMDYLPPPKLFKNRFPRKRRLEGNAVEGAEGADGKKVKDEEEK